MKLSIFNKGKDEKQSGMVDEVVDATFDSLPEIICEHMWTPGLFKKDGAGNMRRRAGSFEYAEVLGIDIDEDLTLQDAIKRLVDAGYEHLIGTTRHHQIPKGDKPACDRFRILVFSERPITSNADFKATLNTLKEQLLPELDKSCIDGARFFNPCTRVVARKRGKLVPVVKGSEFLESKKLGLGDCREVLGTPTRHLSQSTLEFIAHGATEGKWHLALVSATYNMKATGYLFEEAVKLLQKATLQYEGELNETDLSHIRDIYNNRDVQPSVGRYIKGVSDNMPVDGIFNEYCRQFDVGYIRDGKLITIIVGGKIEKHTQSQFESRMLVDLDSSGLKRIDKDLVKRRIGIYIDEQDLLYVNRVRRRLSYDINADTSGVENFVKLLCGENNPNHHLDVAVLKHFGWQVKRKLNDLPVDHHMMPVIVGQQGIGKSVAISKFLKPISEFVGTPPDLPTLSDSRCSPFLFKYYVLFFDEMARAQKADINKLKNIISSDSIEYRPLYSNALDERKNTATFLGCSNNGVAETINDTTGVRRFWEIKTRERGENWDETSKTIWAQLNALDYLSMWKAINEKAESPIIPALTQIQAYQESELRSRDSVELFLEQSEIEKLSPTSDQNEWETAADVYHKYGAYCVEAGWTPVTREYMGKRLKSLGVTANTSRKQRKYALRRKSSSPF